MRPPIHNPKSKIQNLPLRPLIDEGRIAARVRRLARAIARDHGTRQELIVVGLLKGSFMFMADLVRELHRRRVPLVLDFMTLGSYGGGTRSSGRVRLRRDITVDIADRRVLLVDDILDTGRTLTFAVAHLAARGPSGVRTCVLLDKPARRAVPFAADYVGFPIPDAFVVGYGLDYDHRYREWPGLCVVQGAP